jgi:hypothetical protein
MKALGWFGGLALVVLVLVVNSRHGMVGIVIGWAACAYLVWRARSGVAGDARKVRGLLRRRNQKSGGGLL